MEHDLVVVAVRAGDVMGRCSRGKMRLDGNQVGSSRTAGPHFYSLFGV